MPTGPAGPARDRRAMDAIFFGLRTRCRCDALSATGLCSSSSAHGRFQSRTAAGVFLELWRRGLTEYDWLAADGAMTKAPLGGGTSGRDPTERGKRGATRSILTEAAGVPVGVTVAGANVAAAASPACSPVQPRERPRRVLAHERLRVVGGLLQHGHVVRRADGAEHHGGGAPQAPQLRALHRRVAERAANSPRRHREQLPRERARGRAAQRSASRAA